ncbi:homocysteine S-methyltransferase family protein [Sporohalobacter salinus]|uniref:homocysteine S-methyltransferase family protein n=1 Tax=Sporohalobacter salinus TaxID=1494606 RepID=UPI0019607FEB|nr:homocysteine S-methyltransferase family protein [Sporohalobacter salinus]MBM7623860.1 5-methyltetrahydrofolate--homocysteine methyltransferase [Sporohalobacter salinus]
MKSDILTELESEIILFDGAMGTQLQQSGLETDTAPEEWNLKKPEVIKEIHQKYLAAGSRVVQTNTFGANRLKLEDYGLENKVTEINQAAVKIAQSVQKDNYVAGSIGPLGKLFAPMGSITFKEGINIFTEQITALNEAGVDLISFETMNDLQELRAAVIAAKEVSDKVPIVAQMTFDENLRTLSGTTPQIAATVLDSLGVDIIGANCSLGPEGLLKVLKALNEVTNKPIIIQPNAGLPEIVDGKTVYQKSPEEMANYIEKFVQHGANIIGGCCGTTPEHIEVFAYQVSKLEPKESTVEKKFRLASSMELVELTKDSQSLMIGERINPSGREKMTAELKEGELSIVTQEIKDQIEAGAEVLDINVGGAGIDEVEMMQRIIKKVQNLSRASVTIDTTNSEVLKAGLEAFAGKALINSVTGEEESLNKILPLAKKYGSALICLTLDDDGIPDTAEGRFEVAKKIKKRANKYGIDSEDLLIDTLTLTASTKQQEVIKTLEAIKLVKEELGLKTVLGVSNVSYGLPQKPLLNKTFMAMALSYGLDAYIIDPLNKEMQETILASEVLVNRDQNAERYITTLQSREPEENVVDKDKINANEDSKRKSHLELINKAVLNGERKEVISLIDSALTDYTSDEIMNQALIPAIEEVGEKYDTGEYFLPQLMASAETMKEGFQHVKNELTTEANSSKKGRILLATVRGDVHDIGKNIVKVVLENHGFDVIDLGKDVATEKIVKKAKKKKVDVVGLSALMTTTMVEMEQVVELLKEEGVNVKVILGGAVVNKEYANKIGADGYAIDAIDTVKIIEDLLH